MAHRTTLDQRQRLRSMLPELAHIDWSQLRRIADEHDARQQALHQSMLASEADRIIRSVPALVKVALAGNASAVPLLAAVDLSLKDELEALLRLYFERHQVQLFIDTFAYKDSLCASTADLVRAAREQK